MDESDSTDADEAIEGFGAAAPIYRERGWESPFPLPKGEKFPPPKGTTGREGKTPNPQQITAWRRKNPHGNTGLRLPDGVIGIDVDAYGDKTGGRALREAEKRWGPLPPTVISSSRDDCVSGIRLYRIPQSIDLPGDIKLMLDDGTLVGDIEIIQWFHRYVVAWPSIHPSGHRYQWLDSDWNPLTRPRHVDDLPDLPKAWLAGLSAIPSKAPKAHTAGSAESTASGQTASTARHSAEFDAAVAEALTEGTMSPTVLRRFTKAVNDCAGPGRHDTIRDHVMALLRYGYSREPGVRTALLSLRTVFIDAVSVDRKGGENEAVSEFHRMITGAGRLLAEGVQQLDFDPPVEGAEPARGEDHRQVSRVDHKQDGDTEHPRLWPAPELEASKPLEWLIKNFIPLAAVTLLVGDEGIGKSALWVWLTVYITTGKPCLEFGIPLRDPADVILVLTEDDWSTVVRPRLEVAGVDLNRVHVVAVERDGSGAPTFPDHMDVLTSAGITPALVIVDAWLDTVPSKLSVRDPQQARQALHPWKEYVTTVGAAVLLLTHTNRVATPNARDKYGATAELRKEARMTLFAQADSEADDCLIVGPEKSNITRAAEASRFRITSARYTEPTEDSDGTVPLLEYVGPVGKSTRELMTALTEIPH
ncbi:bifunctional DNA primase/polymerase [Mycolicibacterium sp. 120270]|uniref:bifunctional DNA primase/polymerase n=1 Tax=Mycolicibacterium sp. 120270 TaxID=3090600 RepID=UPI00299E9C79|nr:bifunctional DNA primase/polymerase [Mycolicibacterium sp. 120270]MDX1886528.1 bifunctional DNA primase/polymerase [Mycolicibacterium sp. 120270]